MKIAKFNFSPKIIRLLGEELIHDKKIAISELVKNAYDADAQNIKITVANDEIVILDDGCGMDEDIISKYWLCPGNSIKRTSKARTPKFGRFPVGEKGVGRLGVHRLGAFIQVVSKSSGNPEVVFEIDWEEFEDAADIEDLTPIKIHTSPSPTIFDNERTGTQLTIRKLKEDFNDSDIVSLKKDLLKMLSPFEDNNDSFKIELHTKNGLFSDEESLTVADILEKAFFKFRIVFEGDEITEFNYKFTPPPHPKIQPRERTYIADVKDHIKKFKKKLKNDQRKIDGILLAPTPVDFGEVVFRGYVFETGLSRSLNAGYSKETTNYLKSNGGIRVYRDGMRVYNYGEDGKDNDILNLDRKRIKKLGDNIGYNQILATIELDLEKSNGLLKEKTNREGFIHNDSFRHLQRCLDLCMETFIHYRNLDKAEISLLVGKQYDKGDIDTRIDSIKSKIEKSGIPDNEKKKINENLNSFSEEFKHIKNVFLTASNTGLNMTFIIHEVDKIIDNLEEEIKKQDFAKVENVFNYLKETINSFKETIRLDKRLSAIKLNSIVEQTVFNTKYRFKCHEITLHQELDENISIVCKKGLVIGLINNVFDNSIYWLDTYGIKRKKIFIKSYSDQLHHHLVIADNGKGFNISFEAALGPFISGRLEDSSMGIGLHLASQVMEAHQGSIENGNWQEEKLPEEFANGAIIHLRFPKEVA